MGTILDLVCQRKMGEPEVKWKDQGRISNYIRHKGASSAPVKYQMRCSLDGAFPMNCIACPAFITAHNPVQLRPSCRGGNMTVVSHGAAILLRERTVSRVRYPNGRMYFL